MTSALRKAEELFEAIQANDFHWMKELLACGANPSRLLLNGVTPFHLAVGADSTSCFKYVEEILKHNGNPNVFDTEGHTPLHVAAEWGKADCLQILLQYGGDVNIADKEGNDVRWYAKDNSNCLLLLNEFQKDSFTHRDDDLTFSYRFQKIPLNCIGNLTKGSLCTSCAKRKMPIVVSMKINENNNLEDPKKFAKVVQNKCWQSPHSPEAITKVNTPNTAKTNSKDCTITLSHASPVSSGVTRPTIEQKPDEVAIPLQGFNPNNLSIRTGIDATSPDNCYMFVRKHLELTGMPEKTLCLPHDVSTGSSDLDSISSTPHRSSAYTSSSYSSSSSPFSETLFSADKARQLLLSTNPCKTENAVSMTSPLKDDTVEYQKVTEESSVFTLANSTVALDETSLRIDSLPSPNSEVYTADTKNQNEDSLHSTYMKDISNVLPESLKIGSLSENDEIFLYSDSEGDSFIEHRRIPSVSNGEVLSPTNELSISQEVPNHASTHSLSESTVIYDWKELSSSFEDVNGRSHQRSADARPVVIPHEILTLTDKELRQRLIERGCKPGPISAAKKLYCRKLYLLERGIGTVQRQKDIVFSPELRSLIAGKPLPATVKDDDLMLRAQFDNPRDDGGSALRGGTAKDCFNYLLLDPRVTDMLPDRANAISESECLKVFAGSVFYVGKGKKSRPYAHFKEALTKRRKSRLSPKLKHIHEIWDADCGVISLHVFQNVMANEAFTREAAMIDALGIGNLTNVQRGKLYGTPADWAVPRVRRYGTYLLLSAMRILLVEGERQIRPNNLNDQKQHTLK